MLSKWILFLFLLFVLASCYAWPSAFYTEDVHLTELKVKENGNLTKYLNSTHSHSDNLKGIEECNDILEPLRINKPFFTKRPLIQRACEIFSWGTKCINRWSNRCLNKKNPELLPLTIFDGLETYQSLCAVTGFQANVSGYENCFTRISRHWDECFRQFTERLRSLHDKSHRLSTCCVHIRFSECVGKIGNCFCPNELDFLKILAQMSARAVTADDDNSLGSGCNQADIVCNGAKNISGCRATTILFVDWLKLFNFLVILFNFTIY